MYYFFTGEQIVPLDRSFMFHKPPEKNHCFFCGGEKYLLCPRKNSIGEIINFDERFVSASMADIMSRSHTKIITIDDVIENVLSRGV